jgi:hypothetical protein
VDRRGLHGTHPRPRGRSRGAHPAAGAQLPAPTDLLAITRTGRASLVLDLSGLPEDSKSAYLNRLPDAVAAERAQHGIPHWVITDEVHLT